MWDKIKEMLYTFAYVITGVIFAAAIFITIFNPDMLFSVELLWQIAGASFVCVFGNLLYPINVELSKRQMIIRMILHYFYVNIVVFVCGHCFEWFPIDNIKMVLFMALVITVIFVVVSIVLWSGDKKTSELLNKQLKEYQGESDETDLAGGNTR